MKKTGVRIAAILAADLILTAAMVLALAGLAYKMSWEDTQIGIGVVAIYIFANLVGGFLAGKAAKSRRFLWGALGGIIYFAVIAVLACAITRESGADATSMLMYAAICAASGMVGGMLSGSRAG